MAETKFLDSAGLTHLLEKINAKFSKLGHTHTKAEITDFAHTHDDRYYTETEIDSKLNGKSNTGHTHDDRYYTESEMNTKLAGKSDTSHSHSTHLTTEIAAGTNLNTVTTPGWYKCPLNTTSATLTNSPTKMAFAMEVLSNVIATQIIYEYAGNSSPKAYIRSQGDEGVWGTWHRIYTEADKPTASEIGAAAASHTHTKAQITDFPTSMPASDVYAWAKAATKPTYTKSEVGLGNVENKSSATIRGELTKANVTTALGYTPPTSDTNTWQANTVSQNGYVTAPTTFNANKVWKTDANGVPAWRADSDTNTWRGVQNNLTSTATDQSLSAYQGKVLNDKFASYVPAYRTVNGKALSGNISLSAGDVGAAASSHSHNYAGSRSAGGNANWANGATYANCSYNEKPITTAGTGAAYIASVSDLTLIAGASFVMVPHVTSTTTAPTLNVNYLGAKNIRMRLSSNTSSTIQLIKSDFLVANKPVNVVYDGTYWVLDDFAQPDANYLYGTLISSGTSAPSNGTGGFIYIQTT